MIDAELYTISVRKESLEDETYYVARIAELPDVEDFGDSFEEARSLAIETIVSAHALCEKEGVSFPQPLEFKDSADASGRVTLRMPKYLHAKLAQESDKEEVSLNQYIVSSLSMSYGQCQMSNHLLREFKSSFKSLKRDFHMRQKTAFTYLSEDRSDVFLAKDEQSGFYQVSEQHG